MAVCAVKKSFILTSIQLHVSIQQGLTDFPSILIFFSFFDFLVLIHSCKMNIYFCFNGGTGFEVQDTSRKDVCIVKVGVYYKQVHQGWVQIGRYKPPLPLFWYISALDLFKVMHYVFVFLTIIPLDFIFSRSFFVVLSQLIQTERHTIDLDRVQKFPGRDLRISLPPIWLFFTS